MFTFSPLDLIESDMWRWNVLSVSLSIPFILMFLTYNYCAKWSPRIVRTEGRGGEWWVGEEQRFFKAFCIDHKVCFLFWFTIINYILNIRKIPSAFCFDSKYLKAKCFWLQIKLKHFYSKRSPRRSSSKSPFVNASQQSNIRKVLTEEWVHCQLKLIINPFHCTCISLYK